MDDDHMSDIEMKKGFTDIGALGLSTYRGARESGASIPEAFTILAAYFTGLFSSNNLQDKDDDQTSDS